MQPILSDEETYRAATHAMPSTRLYHSTTHRCPVLAATNRNLMKEVRVSRFREDLYYMPNIMEIHIPPLSERPEDIPLLVEHLLLSTSTEKPKNWEIPSRRFGRRPLTPLPLISNSDRVFPRDGDFDGEAGFLWHSYCEI
jgi:hypothetical protein